MSEIESEDYGDEIRDLHQDTFQIVILFNRIELRPIQVVPGLGE